MFNTNIESSEEVIDQPQYQYQNFQSRSRLDARLWLDCRLSLVKCLMMQIRGMGVLPGEDRYLIIQQSFLNILFVCILVHSWIV